MPRGTIGVSLVPSFKGKTEKPRRASSIARSLIDCVMSPLSNVWNEGLIYNATWATCQVEQSREGPLRGTKRSAGFNWGWTLSPAFRGPNLICGQGPPPPWPSRHGAQDGGSY